MHLTQLSLNAFIYLNLYGAVPPALFNAPRVYPLNHPAPSIAIADFDGDGAPDVAAINVTCEYCQAFVSILMNNGHGGYQPPRSHPVGNSFVSLVPQAIVAADFNRDGKPDLAVANSGDGTISILINTGGGSFGGQKRYIAGSFASSVVAGDFNGDGITDLAIGGAAGYGFGGYSIMLGKGDGSFSPPAFHSISYCGELAVGDFNRDGKADLALITTNGVSIVLGNGDGSFQSPITYPAGGTNSTFVIAGDFNRDSKPDLAIANDTTVSILLGAGDGTFGPPLPNPVPGSLSLAVADLNGDGITDIAATGTTTVGVNNAAAILFGLGDGTFRRAASLNVPALPQSVAVGDVDGDGHLDLVMGDGQSAVLVLGGNGRGQFQQAPRGFPIAPGPKFARADFNGDGNLDLAAGGVNGISVMPGNGDGTFQQPIGAYSFAGDFTVGDLNGDGKPDFVVAQLYDVGLPGAIVVLLGKGDGTFEPSRVFKGVNGPTSPVIGDFNHDGKMDVMVVDATVTGQPGNVSVLLGNGDGSLRAPITSPAGIAPAFAQAADFNNDGNLDLAVASTFENTVSILLNNGDGTFHALPAFQAPSRRVTCMAVADFNRDGYPDLALGGFFVPWVYVLPGRGDGTFQAPLVAAVADGPILIDVSDFNGDGIPDLATMGGSTVTILAGNGDATFAAWRNYLVGLAGPSSVAGEFHNGRLPDVVLSTQDSSAANSLVVLANVTRQSPGVTPHLPESTSPPRIQKP